MDGKMREGSEARSLAPEEERGTADFGSAPFCTSRSTDIDLAFRDELVELQEPMVLALLWSTLSVRFCGTEQVPRFVSSSATLS
jgi:hypothetical protein